MTKIACVDTNILSWGIVKNPPRGEEYLVQEAMSFLAWLVKEDYELILPAIIVGELLLPVSPEDQAGVLIEVAKLFRIVPFDTAASLRFANIYRNHKDKHHLRHITNPNEPGRTREALKADVMIIASALTNGANVIFSNDYGMKSMAEGFISVKSLSDMEYQLQMNLPDDDEE